MALAPDRASIKALEDALSAVLAAAGGNPPLPVVQRIRQGLASHAAVLEEMLAGFRLDDAVGQERDDPPVRGDVAGPAPDEAGGEDDV